MKLTILNQHIANILPKGIKNWQFILYILVLSFFFLFFQQGDLYHTVLSSNAYLAGHFSDFYDYNKTIVANNDYFPLLYIVFALWNLPLKLFGLIPSFSESQYLNTLPPIHYLTTIEIYWSKLLLVFIFFALAYVLHNIANIISNKNKEQSRTTAALFSTAPIAIFAVFIFGQYDVIGVLIAMVGYYYYLQKKLTHFACFFSLAISFKFLPILIFVPLLLLSEKRITYLLKYFFIAISVPLMQIAIYWHNIAFKKHTLFSLASGKLNALVDIPLSVLNHPSYFIVFYLIICLYAYIKEPCNENERQQQSIFISIATYGVLFSTIIWHPQWLILITPFFALSTLYIKQKEKFYLIELIGMIAFIVLTINYWPHHVDVSMIHSSPLGSLLFPIPIIVNADFIGNRYFPLSMALFFIYLFSPLLMLQFQKSSIVPLIHLNSYNQYFCSRFIVGLGFFLITSLFCIFIPNHAVAVLFPQQYTKNYLDTLTSETIAIPPQRPAGEIINGNKLDQSFIATHNNLYVISIMMATYARKNDSKIKFSLFSDTNKQIYSQEIAAKQIKDSAFYNMFIPVLPHSKGKRYHFIISSIDATPGNAITAYMTENKQYFDGILLVNNNAVSADLIMQLYFKP